MELRRRTGAVRDDAWMELRREGRVGAALRAVEVAVDVGVDIDVEERQALLACPPGTASGWGSRR